MEQLLLSVDQHAQLLSRSRVLTDLISLSLSNDGTRVRIEIAEPKFTLADVRPTGEPVGKAIRQFRSTVARLERFGVSYHSQHGPVRLSLALRCSKFICLIEPF
jgi:hypothetical protein